MDTGWAVITWDTIPDGAFIGSYTGQVCVCRWEGRRFRGVLRIEQITLRAYLVLLHLWCLTSDSGGSGAGMENIENLKKNMWGLPVRRATAHSCRPGCAGGEGRGHRRGGRQLLLRGPGAAPGV